jgi:hypothetical protein
MGHPGKIQGDVGISGEDIGIFGGGTGRSREIQEIHERSERGTGKSMKNTGGIHRDMWSGMYFGGSWSYDLRETQDV